MYYDSPLFHLFVLLFLSTGFLAQQWYAIGKRFRILVADADNNAENQEWTFVPRSLNRTSPIPQGTEERVASSKREASRAVFSIAFLATKVAIYAIATTSFISSVLNFGSVRWSNRSYHTFDNKDYMTRIEHAYETITNDKARMKWEEQSGLGDSSVFVQSYYLVFFVGLTFWFLAVRKVYLLFRRTAAKATLYDLHTTTTPQVLYQNLKSDRELRCSLFAGARLLCGGVVVICS